MKLVLLFLCTLLVQIHSTSVQVYHQKHNVTQTEYQLQIQKQLKLMDPITVGLIALAVGTFANTIQDVINCFKYSNSTIYKNILKQEGFNYYEADSVSRLTSIPYRYYDMWTSNEVAFQQIPDDTKHIIEDGLNQAMWQDRNLYNYNEIVYNKDITSNNRVRYGCFMTINDDNKEVIHVLQSNFDVKFELAPDLVWYKNTQVIQSGSKEISKDIIVERPAYITLEDYQAIMTFFKTVAFKSFAEKLRKYSVDITIKLPDLDDL